MSAPRDSTWPLWARLPGAGGGSSPHPERADSGGVPRPIPAQTGSSSGRALIGIACVSARWCACSARRAGSTAFDLETGETEANAQHRAARARAPEVNAPRHGGGPIGIPVATRCSHARLGRRAGSTTKSREIVRYLAGLLSCFGPARHLLGLIETVGGGLQHAHARSRGDAAVALRRVEGEP